jgi:hypothetical protein
MPKTYLASRMGAAASYHLEATAEGTQLLQKIVAEYEVLRGQGELSEDEIQARVSHLL